MDDDPAAVPVVMLLDCRARNERHFGRSGDERGGWEGAQGREPLLIA